MLGLLHTMYAIGKFNFNHVYCLAYGMRVTWYLYKMLFSHIGLYSFRFCIMQHFFYRFRELYKFFGFSCCNIFIEFRWFLFVNNCKNKIAFIVWKFYVHFYILFQSKKIQDASDPCLSLVYCHLYDCFCTIPLWNGE